MKGTIQRIAVRQLGSGAVHVADVSESRLSYAEVFGAPCQAVVGAIKTCCYRTLNRQLVVRMEEARVTCPQCREITGIEGVGIKYREGYKPRKHKQAS